jgi:CO/xanthine dehydrogenase FAD-binding subunit
MALWLAVEPQGVVRSARLAVGPGGPRPFRAARTERFLEGSQPTADLAAAAGEVLLEEIQLRTSAHRATKRYREGLASVLLERCLERVQGQLRANPVEAS